MQQPIVTREPWIVTASGVKMHPLFPRAAEISIGDIAHALSNICRFGGHTREFYSVAQHSVIVSQHCHLENALYGLLHDASEAYLGDIVRPLKHSDHFAGYREIERNLQDMIYSKYIPFIDHEPDELAQIDTAVMLAEARDLGLSTEGWEDAKTIQPIDVTIVPLSPQKAEEEFIKWFTIVLDSLVDSVGHAE